jgi:hypothetical protein
VKDREKTHRITGVILIMVSDYWVYHRECFLLICGLFFSIQAVFRLTSLFVGVEIDLVADWFQIVSSLEVFRSARIS